MGGLFSKKKKPHNTNLVNKEQKDYPSFKILMIGDPSVGKSSLLLRYADNEFTNNFISTIGVDYVPPRAMWIFLAHFQKEKEVPVKGDNVTIQIWDTAGQERFRTITSSYYRGAQGMILTFDLTNAASFKSLSKWLQEVERYAEEDVVVVLAGNKVDMGEDAFTVPQSEIDEFKSKYGLDFFRTSAKEGTNVSEMFQRLSEQVVERYNNVLYLQ